MSYTGDSTFLILIFLFFKTSVGQDGVIFSMIKFKILHILHKDKCKITDKIIFEIF